MDCKPFRLSRPDLPISYQKNCLVVLMCDPGRVYAFWEVPEAGKSLTLRLRTADPEPREELVRIAELSAGQQIGSAYLEVPAGAGLQLEWGEYRTDNFQPELKSNPLLLPKWASNSPPRKPEPQFSLVGYAGRIPGHRIN